MASYWQAEVEGASIEVAVEEPGAGVLGLHRVPAGYDDAAFRSWGRLYAGVEVGALLVELTHLALAGAADRVLLPSWVDGRFARALLPPVMHAALLAAAGEDRYERLYPDPDEPPAAPLCARCGEGGRGPVATSDRCAEQGHRAFGCASANWARAWQQFQERHAWWESTRPSSTAGDGEQ